MIRIKNSEEIALMREAGKITGGALALAETLVKPGVSLIHLDSEIHRFITSHDAKPSFLHYNGFPASACISVNSEVIHGIPDKRILKEGDIVKIDVGACYKGFHGDAARTFFVGDVSEEAERLARVTKESFFEGVKAALPGNRIGDIGHNVQEHAEAAGFSVVREFVGHGVGANLHEDPEVPNFGRPGRGPRLYENMTIAIEPMINAGKPDVFVTENDWTVETEDGRLSAHYENTVLITANGPELLTAYEL